MLAPVRLLWFSRLVWIGIFANLFFAVGALAFPDVVNSFFGLPTGDTTWLRNAGMLLILLCMFYYLVGCSPAEHLSFAWLCVVARFIAAAFWLWLVCWQDASSKLLWLFAVDLLIGLLQGWVLLRDRQTSARTRRSFFSLALGFIFRVINRWIVWHRLPRILGAVNLLALRTDLRELNLYDTRRIAGEPPPQPAPSTINHRSADGSWTDLKDGNMGRAGTRFGRNMPLDEAWPHEETLLKPNPREISNRLFARTTFQPASHLNLLAAAWIQFMNHGWFNHKKFDSEIKGPFVDVPLPDGDEWRTKYKLEQMRFFHTQPDPTRSFDSWGPPTYINTESHWWDGSQIYGSSLERQLEVRSMKEGKLKLVNGRLPGLPVPPYPKRIENIDLTGFFDNYWIGLSLLHTLFVLEHNSICDALLKQEKAKHWDDERLFQVARLINAALMAKIHTVEWTPGILDHPALKMSMYANWWGLFGKRFKKKYGRISDSEAISGIIGSPLDHHSAPYSLTEEFVSVYRLHSLIPDTVNIVSLPKSTEELNPSFSEVQGNFTRPFMQKKSLTDFAYSFGIQHPGALRLHNFPNTLRDFERIEGDRLDLAALDIYRDRERAVPRYNRFRELLRMPRMKSFTELTGGDEKLADEVREVYGNDIDLVDLQVGLHAEPLPKGYGFSDTAFRIFILMASRRLKSDRFFTTHYTEDVYTKTGLNWVEENDMSSVLCRHFPQLSQVLSGVTNAFAPWKKL